MKPGETDNTKWHPTKIHWSDFPGRDQHWKEIQLATMNNNLIRWNQEYECKFLGSVVTLINADKIEEFKSMFQDKSQLKKPYEILLNDAFPELKINMYVPPQPGRAYLLGADPSTGDGGDYHAMTVWDITNTYNIELVADFSSNKLSPKQFAYILAKTGFLYNCAYIAIENNGVSYATIENLTGDFEYYNIVHLGGNPKTSIAIHSTPQLKLDACLTMKELIEDPLRKVLIYNSEILDQMERFEKRSKQGKEPTYGCFSCHDDLIMSMIWALYCLKPTIVDTYFNVKKYAVNKLGNTIPLIIMSEENSESPEIQEIIRNLDKTFEYLQSVKAEDIPETIEQDQANLMSNFLETNEKHLSKINNPNYDSDDDYFNENSSSNNQDDFDFFGWKS